MYVRLKQPVNKLRVLIGFMVIAGAIIIAQLFNLQILKHGYFQEIAAKAHFGSTELPARRGEIIIKDQHSNEEFRLATNTTLDLLYADPSLIENSMLIAAKIGPLLFDLEEAREKDAERIKEMKKQVSADIPEEEINKILQPKTEEELRADFIQDLADQMSQKRRQKILLATELSPNILETIAKFELEGVKVLENYLYAYPPQITDPGKVAETLAPYIEISELKIEKLLTSENRYTVLKKKLRPEISTQIKEMAREDKEGLFFGIGLQEEYYRFYPENELGANILGFVDHEGMGQYGIESKFNVQLRGKTGIFQTQKDSIGRQITVGDSVIKPAEDGDDIVLTIDRSVQLEADRIIERGVRQTDADSGLILIMNPQTGAVIAMSHYPSFNPNSYGDVFEKETVNLRPGEIDTLYPINEEDGIYYLYKNVDTDDKITIFKEIQENGEAIYKKYKNDAGALAYQNKAVGWVYEPGSVFKSVTMAIALDDGDITPNTTYFDSGPIQVDEFEIHNSTDEYFGWTNMTTVLEKSLNTGMTFVAKKIGRTLFGSYLKKFGFGERTDIEFNNELGGRVEHFTHWAESELVTHAFGQGLTVSPIQLVNAYCAIANGGILMQPHIVSEIRHQNGKVTKYEPVQIRRVISEQTSSTLTAMLISSVEHGVAAPARVARHYVAGKTGTSQTYKWGKPLIGAGTTLTSFVGYGPVENPRFVVLVKLDHPRSNEWGAVTAAPIFSQMGTFLYDYYNIPPDK
ncbi:MAG: penicillin-binding protein 2 [Patescibacteria group bacterium]|nr:penicillin-binding protein 2 [Patescibacteria group bacterium]